MHSSSRKQHMVAWSSFFCEATSAQKHVPKAVRTLSAIHLGLQRMLWRSVLRSYPKVLPGPEETLSWLQWLGLGFWMFLVPGFTGLVHKSKGFSHLLKEGDGINWHVVVFYVFWDFRERKTSHFSFTSKNTKEDYLIISSFSWNLSENHVKLDGGLFGWTIVGWLVQVLQPRNYSNLRSFLFVPIETKPGGTLLIFL